MSNPGRAMWEVFLLLLVLVSCDQSFDPRQSSDPIPIVYAILATNKGEQFVRLYTQYDASSNLLGTERIEKPVVGALITLGDAGTSYTLADTLLSRPDSSRYEEPIYAYKTTSLILQYGTNYTLAAQSPVFGSITSTVFVPNHAMLFLTNTNLLSAPRDYEEIEKATVTAILQPGAKAYIVRLILCYDVLGQNGWERRREEIPVSFRSKPHKHEQALYGRMIKLGSSLTILQPYSNEAYQILINNILDRTRPNKLIFDFVVLQFVQVEENLYNYYSVTGGFQDPFSLRLDQANYTNIKGGAGLFGAYAVDSLVQILPYDFIYNRR